MNDFLRDGGAVRAMHGAYIPNRYCFRTLTYNMQRIASPRIERLNERRGNVHKDNFQAALRKKLRQKAPANVTGAELYSRAAQLQLPLIGPSSPRPQRPWQP
jgi:hypothetical protein